MLLFLPLSAFPLTWNILFRARQIENEFLCFGRARNNDRAQRKE